MLNGTDSQPLLGAKADRGLRYHIYVYDDLNHMAEFLLHSILLQGHYSQ